MARGSRRKVPTNNANAETSTAGQGALPGTAGGQAETKKTKKRRTDDQIEADLKEKLAAVQQRKALAKVGENKPLLAAIKAAKRLKKWLSAETYAMVDVEIQAWIDANGTPEALGDESEDDSESGGDSEEGESDGAAA